MGIKKGDFLESAVKLAAVVEAALWAEEVAATDILAQADQQGVVFIKQPSISRQMSHKKLLIGSIAITIWS